MNLNKSTENVQDAWGQLPSNLQPLVSQVLKVESIDWGEKIITIEIPLNDVRTYENNEMFDSIRILHDGKVLQVTWSQSEIIRIRKYLELKWLIPPSINHDEEAQNSLSEIQEMQKWWYPIQDKREAINYKKEYEEKKQSEKRQKDLMPNIMQSLLDGKAYVVKSTQKTKNVLIEVLIVSDKTLDTLSKKDTWIKTGKIVMSKEIWIKTGKTLMDVVDQWVNTTFPWVIDTLPLVRKQIVMTSKQIIDTIQSHTKNIIKKKEQKSSNIQE